MGKPAGRERPWARWPGWLVANEVGAILGWLALTGTSALVIQRHPGEPGWFIFGGAAIVALSGGILGAAQRTALRPRISVVGWVVATAGGMGLGYLLYLPLFGGLSLAPPGSVASRLVSTWTARSGVYGGVYGLSTGACKSWSGGGAGSPPGPGSRPAPWALAGGGFCTTVVRGAVPGGRTPGDLRSMAIGPLLDGLATAAALRQARTVGGAEGVGGGAPANEA